MNRYSGSVESTSARDYLDVIQKEGEAAIIWFDQVLAKRTSTMAAFSLDPPWATMWSPKDGKFTPMMTRLDWMTGNVPQPGELDDHHIVPKSWGTENLDGNLVDTILNRSPLTSETNRFIIRDRLPNEYLPQWIAKNTDQAVGAILRSHFISAKALQSPWA
jgi:hypothetical protein